MRPEAAQTGAQLPRAESSCEGEEEKSRPEGPKQKQARGKQGFRREMVTKTKNEDEGGHQQSGSKIMTQQRTQPRVLARGCQVRRVKNERTPIERMKGYPQETINDEKD
ncbi:hypothetical protein K438DRAFT_1786489 [Mycena galopus ATCC 62051]|nr:hypothetical protein K438DRAFT_1786489 [Mycena galopus ATCC 62051]